MLFHEIFHETSDYFYFYHFSSWDSVCWRYENDLNQKHSGCVIHGSVVSLRLPATWPVGCKAACVWIDDRCLSSTGRLSQGAQAAGQNIQYQKFMGNFDQGCPRDLFLDHCSLILSLTTCSTSFIEKCSLHNYADDNSLSISAPTAENVESQTCLWDIITLVYAKSHGSKSKLIPNKILPLPRNLFWKFWAYVLIVALLFTDHVLQLICQTIICIILIIEVPRLKLQKINIQEFCVEQFHMLSYRLAIPWETE